VPRPDCPELDQAPLAAYFHVPEQDLGGPPEDAPAVIPPQRRLRRAESIILSIAYSAPYVAVPFLAVDASAVLARCPMRGRTFGVLFERRTARQARLIRPGTR
jgi:hypothetical protein